MMHTPNFGVGGGCDPYVTINRVDGTCLYNYKQHARVKQWRKGLELYLNVERVAIRGDTQIVFYDASQVGKDQKMFSLWINTAFLKRNSYTFRKPALDKACKDTKNKYFSAAFSVTVLFEGVRSPNNELVDDENNAVYELATSPPDAEEDEEDEEDEDDKE